MAALRSFSSSQDQLATKTHTNGGWSSVLLPLCLLFLANEYASSHGTFYNDHIYIAPSQSNRLRFFDLQSSTQYKDFYSNNHRLFEVFPPSLLHVLGTAQSKDSCFYSVLHRCPYWQTVHCIVCPWTYFQRCVLYGEQRGSNHQCAYLGIKWNCVYLTNKTTWATNIY